MQSFASIFDRAAQRHGGDAALRTKLSTHYVGPTGAVATNTKGDDRWLAEFTKRVFQAGFNWGVIDKKWDGFERAFWGFSPSRCAHIDMDDMEALTVNKEIVRNPKKIKTVPINAQMILNMTETAGSADQFIRGWDKANYIGLLDYLQKHGSHLGFNTASYALRFSGVASFILSRDVTAALIHAGVIDKPATSKTAKKALQAAFNHWSEESGEDLTFISRTLAHSIDAG